MNADTTGNREREQERRTGKGKKRGRIWKNERMTKKIRQRKIQQEQIKGN